MRTNCNIQTGQIWRGSDPRRLFAFRVYDVNVKDAYVYVSTLYPNPSGGLGLRTIKLENFQVTGPKGYHRIS